MSAAVPGDLVVAAAGAAVRIAFADDVTPHVRERVHEAWADARIPEPEVADRTVTLPHRDDEDAALERLSIDVTLAALEHGRGSRVMLHAAGVAAPDGRVIAFIGPSGTGKTTLSRVLGTRYGYVSDETIAFDDDLTVHPHRKPLSIVRDGRPKEQVAPRAVGMQPLPDQPLRLAALVLLHRTTDPTGPSLAHPELRRVALLDALEDLVPQLSYLADLPAPLQRLARTIDALGGVHRLTYSEASDLPPIVDAIFADSPPSSPPDWRHVDLSRVATRTLRVANVVDAISTDERTAVLGGGTVTILGGIAPTLLDALQQGVTEDELAEAVLQAHGEPGDGADAVELVSAAVSALVDARVLDREQP